MLDAAALDQIFRTARTDNWFSGEVTDAQLRALWDLMKFGPTTANAQPLRAPRSWPASSSTPTSTPPPPECRARSACSAAATTLLGLPLMQLLDRAQFASVIAHEFGHFSQENGRFNGWIYRVRLSWYRVLDALAGRGVAGAALLARFYAWYVPYFNAYSFALARHEEYGADAVAARVAGADAAASTLIRVELAQRRLNRDVWSRLPARMRAQRQPLHGRSLAGDRRGASEE